MPEPNSPHHAVQRFPWRSPLWIGLHVLPIALAITTARVFGSAAVALVRTTLEAPPSERFADLGLALVALATVGIVGVVGAIFVRAMLVPGWRHAGDAYEVHPDRLVAVEHGARRDIAWTAFVGEPIVDDESSRSKTFLRPRSLTYQTTDGPLRLPDSHLHQRDIVLAIAKARAAHPR